MSQLQPKSSASGRPQISPSRVAVRAQVQLHWAHVMAVLVTQLGDLQRADDALRQAAAAAVRCWPNEGSPTAPKAWLLRAARRNAVTLQSTGRRQTQAHAPSDTIEQDFDADIPDLRLQLLLGCTHTSLNAHTHMALLLHCGCGIDTAQIAQIMGESEIDLAQRLARAKKRLRRMTAVFTTDPREQWEERRALLLEAVLNIYRVGSGQETSSMRWGDDLREQGVWLSQILLECCPDDAEVISLSALLTFSQASSGARFGDCGERLALQDQNASCWNKPQISAARRLLSGALDQNAHGAMQLRACIVAEKMCAKVSAKSPDWEKILEYYRALYSFAPSSEVALNAAIAVFQVEGVEEGYRALQQLGTDQRFHRNEDFFVAMADVLLSSGDVDGARSALEYAIECPTIEPSMRQAIGQRLDSLDVSYTHQNQRA